MRVMALQQERATSSAGGLGLPHSCRQVMGCSSPAYTHDLVHGPGQLCVPHNWIPQVAKASRALSATLTASQTLLRPQQGAVELHRGPLQVSARVAVQWMGKKKGYQQGA